MSTNVSREHEPGPPGREAPPRPASIGRWLCLSGAAVGALRLVDGLLGARLFASLPPGEPPMTLTTALCLLLSGGAGALRWREDPERIARSLSLAATLVVFAVGIGSLVVQALGHGVGAPRLVAPVLLEGAGRPA